MTHPAITQILDHFRSDHLPEDLQRVSQRFGILAHATANEAPNDPETTVALRKLLEAKDAAVRAYIRSRKNQNARKEDTSLRGVPHDRGDARKEWPKVHIHDRNELGAPTDIRPPVAHQGELPFPEQCKVQHPVIEQASKAHDAFGEDFYSDLQTIVNKYGGTIVHDEITVCAEGHAEIIQMMRDRGFGVGLETQPVEQDSDDWPHPSNVHPQDA